MISNNNKYPITTMISYAQKAKEKCSYLSIIFY